MVLEVFGFIKISLEMTLTLRYVNELSLFGTLKNPNFAPISNGQEKEIYANNRL